MAGFTLWGEEYELCLQEYNCRGETERAVEIPVASRWLSRQSGSGLEVGNVLSHYQPVAHTVCDKYEVGDGVVNMDVRGWHHRADWILSISTLEHVQWDHPEPREPGGAFAALLHLIGLLAPGGHMLVTVPWGCNPPLDQALRDWPPPQLERTALLVRQPGTPQEWREASSPRPYGGDTEWADTVWIGEFVQS